MQSLATEMEAMKLFIKEQFCLLKINSNTDATDDSITETTDLLRQHIEFLLQGNASKNTIIKILAENQQHASNTKEVVCSESFKTVKGNLIKFIMQNTITGKTKKCQTDYRQHLIMQYLEKKRKWSSLLIVY